MAALLFAPLVVPDALPCAVDALPLAGCALFVPALGVGEELAPGELLLGTVCEGVLEAPPAPGAELPV